MIGYVKVYKPELKVKELATYNAYYCGICTVLDSRYGLMYRNILNYDTVFFAIFADSFNDFECDTESFRCALSPLKKKQRCLPSTSMCKAADITVFMTYYKLLDNKKDENSFWSGLAARTIKKNFIKSKTRIGDIAEQTENTLNKLHEFERKQSNNIDAVSDCYATIISDLLVDMVNTSNNDFEAVKWIGYNIGKWIYILDSVEDIEEDLSSGAYNPLLKRYPLKDKEEMNTYKKRIEEKLSFVLFSCLEQASSTFDLIDKKVNSGIIRNILYEGMYHTTHKILNGENPNGIKKPI